MRMGGIFSELKTLNKNIGLLLDSIHAKKSEAAAVTASKTERATETADGGISILTPEESPAETSIPMAAIVSSPGPEPSAASVAVTALVGTEEPVQLAKPEDDEPVKLAPLVKDESGPESETQSVELPTSEEKKTEPVAEKPPRVPSAFELKLNRISNWFLYGTPEVSAENIEKQAATTWLLRVGILVILFTSAFLLKLSIEQGVLAPEGRVGLSYLAGIALIFWGKHQKMRTRYWGLGQGFIGLGFAMLYFASFAMTAMYHLVSPYVSGAIMVLVTIAAGFLAARLDTISIAFVALFGGFLTPALLNTGRVNLTGLGTYLVLLGAGVLALAMVKEWLQLSWVAMLCTYVLYGGAALKGASTLEQYWVVQAFLVLFFGLYSTTTITYNVRKRLSVTALEVVTLLVNSSLFFAMSWWTIAHISSSKIALAFLTVGMAVFYLTHVICLARRGIAEDINLLRTFSGLSALYLALTFPMVFSSAWWSASWALQAVVLLWLGYRMDSRFLRGCSWALNSWMLLRFCIFDFGMVMVGQMSHHLAFTWLGCVERLFEFGLPILALAASAWLSKHFQYLHDDSNIDIKAGQISCSIPMSWAGAWKIQAVVFSITFVLAMVYLSFEVLHCLSMAMPFRGAGLTILWICGCYAALFCHRRALPGYWLKGFVPLLLFLIAMKIGFEFIDTCVTGKLLFKIVQYSDFWYFMTSRLMNFGILAVALYFFSKSLYEEDIIKRVCTYAWPVLLFFYTTAEWSTIIQHKLPGLSGGGISVLWALFAFALVFNGLRNKVRWLRYAGLGFFTVIIFKVFFFDISHLSAVYRVLAFLLFGVALIGASFIYLKLWDVKEKKQE